MLNKGITLNVFGIANLKVTFTFMLCFSKIDRFEKVYQRATVLNITLQLSNNSLVF